MHRAAAILATACLLAAVVSSCGGGTETVEKTLTASGRAPVQKLVLARRAFGRPRMEAGEGARGAARCHRPAGGGVKTVYLRSLAAPCLRVAPRDRLLFVNATGLGPGHRGPVPVPIRLGGYEADVGVGRSALFAAPVGTYLEPGLHAVDTEAAAPPPSILVLPEGCALRAPHPGQGLCLHATAPPCRASQLQVRSGRGGAAAGTSYVTFLVINRSSRLCTVSGRPRLITVDAQGRPVGAPVEAHGSAIGAVEHAKIVALGPGDAATFQLRAGSAGNYTPDCGARRSTAIRITIPGIGTPPPAPFQIEHCVTLQNIGASRIE